MDKCKHNIICRLNRLEGQFKGIKKMIDADADCSDLITQLSAIKSATNSIIGLILIEKYKQELSKSPIDEKEIQQIEKMILKK